MKIYLVGGAVRDKLLGLPIKERDWVVVGATAQIMLDMGYRQVGKEFPVFLHPKNQEEYALARMERKVNPGYKGFTFDASPDVSLEADLVRRDLTINAMAETPEGTLIDPFHGKEDLENRVLRHVSPAFSEDPVRILRIGRFLARYAYLGFHVAPETLTLMRDMVAAGEVDALVAERVWKELKRALTEKNPEKFFEILAECGALTRLFPGLTINGSGMKALKAAASSPSVVCFAALLYDMPKAKKTIPELCLRYRAPNEYRELALLTAQYYAEALTATSLTTEPLLNLLTKLDVFRREKRFHCFLQACRAIASARDVSFDSEWLKTAGQIAKAFPVQSLIDKGLGGNELVSEIKKGRMTRLDAWLQK